MGGGSQEGSYSRLIDFVHHSTLGLRVIKKRKYIQLSARPREAGVQGRERREFRSASPPDEYRGTSLIRNRRPP